MRKCVLGMWVVACLYISGCGFADYISGIERDPLTGKVIKVQGGIAEIGAGLLVGTGGAAGAAGGLLGWALKAYRHKRIVDSGGKDDDFDGMPDAPKPPAAPSA
jgi:hypothetical protein